MQASMTDSLPTLTPECIFSLLSGRFEDSFLSLKDLPHPEEFKDMQKAVSRIQWAIENRERIMLIGDYDVDGVISTSVMKLFFASIAYPLEWIIPNRFRDGYGLSTTLIPRIKEADLVITVDNGISAVEAAKACRDLDIDLIITDHHIVPKIVPDAYAIINQKQKACHFPYAEICGAQIAWYLCTALNQALGSKIDMKAYLELVAIAIVADMMPLQHINRAMVQAGIRLLNQSQRPCIKAFKEHSHKSGLTSEDIAFFLAPILNSAGRLEDASQAVDFVCSKNMYDARVYLEQLIVLNEQRKALEQEITDEAMQKVDSSSKVIVVSSEGWHEGVVGIVAARIARKFEKPAIVLNQKERLCKGSGRSFNGCDLFSLVDAQRGILEKFGGHSAAIGLSIDADRLEQFREALNRKAEALCSQEAFVDPDILGILSFQHVEFPLLALIAQFEPFGTGNSKAKFMTQNVEVLAVQKMGKEGNHLRLTLREADTIHQGVQFKTYECYTPGEHVHIVYTLSENHFRGNTTIQLMVERIIRIGA